MIYNIATRELRTDKGVFLKKLDCPLHKKWSQLQVIPNDTTRRHCESCHKSVLNLETTEDEQAQYLLQNSPDCCVYVPPGTPHVLLEVGSPSHERVNARHLYNEFPCPCRRIQTVRGIDAINHAAREGFWPLVKKVSPDLLAPFMTIYQNQETGEIAPIAEGQSPLEVPWQQILAPFRFHPRRSEPHIAAYLIPEDLPIGEEVYLVDLIDGWSGNIANPNLKSRLDSAYATWKGADFHVSWVASPTIYRMIG